MTTWHAEVRADAGPARLSDEQIDKITAGLPGFPVLRHDAGTGQLALRFQVEAGTIREAAGAAFDAAYGALQAAYGDAPPLTQLRVLTEADLGAELGPPADIIGYAEIGDLLGVTRQRAQQIATRHADFPRPVATPLAGTFYDRAAVLAFRQRWPRRRTGRPARVPHSG